jgi:hypothetical protein
MGYDKIDELAINTIRTLAVSAVPRFLPHHELLILGEAKIAAS